MYLYNKDYYTEASHRENNGFFKAQQEELWPFFNQNLWVSHVYPTDR